MDNLKHSYLPDSTLQPSARATDSTLQSSARTYFITGDEVMKKSPKALGTNPIANSASELSEYQSPDGHDSALQGDTPEKNLRKSIFHSQCKEDLNYWKKTSPEKLEHILELIEDIVQDPFQGKGHPKPLKYQGSDVWSRKIDKKHRIVYLVSADQIDFLQARFHYDDK